MIQILGQPSGEDLSKVMSFLSSKRWKKTTAKERKEVSRKLLEAKRNKKNNVKEN